MSQEMVWVPQTMGMCRVAPAPSFLVSTGCSRFAFLYMGMRPGSIETKLYSLGADLTLANISSTVPAQLIFTVHLLASSKGWTQASSA